MNPRAYLFINVRDINGWHRANWAVEFGNPLDLEKDGWKRSSLHIGDVVTVEGVPAQGRSQAGLRQVGGLDRDRQAIVRTSSKPTSRCAGRPLLAGPMAT